MTAFTVFRHVALMAGAVIVLAPFVALYIWWLPQTRQYEYYFLLVPLFHSLQYLAFAYKMEETRLRGKV